MIALAMLLLAGGAVAAAAPAIERPPVPHLPGEVAVKLVGRATDLGVETVNFGMPLPPGFLNDAALVRVIGEDHREIAAAVRALEPWRIDGPNSGKAGTIRSIQIQFRADFAKQREQTVGIFFGRKRSRDVARFVPVSETLLEPEGLSGPRVLALIPPAWLCDSWVVGPQVPAGKAGLLGAYQALVEKNFPGSLKFIDSPIFDHWLFDRTTCWYKMYVRTGDRKFLEAAYHGAHFVRTHSRLEGPNAGMFIPKGSADLKYVYPRAQHIHYLLTGDERAREAGKIMAALALRSWDPVYKGGFWSPRHEAYGWLGVIHGWELTGDASYWEKVRSYADALWAHQRQPRDGRPPDGSFRENWAQYDSSEAKFTGATSAWMMAILLDPIFHYWTLTGDERIPEMVTRWCDFLDRRGLQPDGRSAYYVINCNYGEPGELPSTVNGDMTRHNTEMSYQFAMGIYFSRDAERRVAYRRRFDALFAAVQDRDLNQPARAFNWAFQASSQLVYFMQHPGGER